jgi:hypothetical protein
MGVSAGLGAWQGRLRSPESNVRGQPCLSAVRKSSPSRNAFRPPAPAGAPPCGFFYSRAGPDDAPLPPPASPIATGSLQILQSPSHHGRTVAPEPERRIARVTEQAAHLAGQMAMVDAQRLYLPADRAGAALSCDERVVFLRGKSILVLTPTCCIAGTPSLSIGQVLGISLSFQLVPKHCLPFLKIPPAEVGDRGGAQRRSRSSRGRSATRHAGRRRHLPGSQRGEAVRLRAWTELAPTPTDAESRTGMANW